MWIGAPLLWVVGAVALMGAGCGEEPKDDGPLVLFPNNDVFDENNKNNEPVNNANSGGENGGTGYGYNNVPGNNGENNSAPVACDDQNPCVEPEVCRDGFCAPECDDATPCDDPLICRENTCQPECDEDTPCADPLICQENRCTFECEESADCDGGEICSANRCVEPECFTDADCDDPLTQVCDDNLCEAQPCALHTFSFDPQGATYDTVHVAGEFNAWPPESVNGLAMTFLPSAGVWYAKMAFDNGDYQYKLVLNDGEEWIQDPGNPVAVDDGFGGMNSLLQVLCVDDTEGGLCGDVEVYDWRDAVMYFLLVDRFFDSDGIADQVAGATGGDAETGPSGQYEGGDLAGVQEKLPYLRDLGVTALWLSAPYENREEAGAAIDPNADPNVYSAYHGYWPSPANIDYSDPDNPTPTPAVEGRIGSDADLRSLIDAAHGLEGADGHGMKVLFDYVMNHVDDQSGLYQARQNDGWFSDDNGNVPLCAPDRWDDPFWGTRCAFTTYLPAFDFDNAAARRWSIDDAMWWAKSYGIDGYRLDAIKHVPLSWLTELRTRLNDEIEDPAGERFYLVGETFDYFNRDLLASFVDPDTMLDGQFDFPLKANLCRAVFSKEQSLQEFSGWMAGNDSFYGPGSLMTTWIGNHDIPRSIHYASRQIPNCTQGSFPGNGWTSDYNTPSDPVPYERLGVAFAILMTNPGIPLIYYGDEIGLAGGGDPDNRRLMPWDDSGLNTHQRALRNRIKALGKIRAENKVITRGRREVLSADDDTWVYRMSGCATASPDVIIAINRADDNRTVQLPAGSYTDLIVNQGAEGGAVQLGPRSFIVYRVR